MPTHYQQRKKNSVFKTAIRKTIHFGISPTEKHHASSKKEYIYIIHMPTHHQQRNKNSVFTTAIRKT